ncbi:MAG TPA: DEAD/DEAH box helicase family protein, partial [Polyangiaceae bacterium]
MDDSSLSEFQSAAVDHIVRRLSDARGSRRFLLADEVGLGKTIVARAVIERLAARHRQAGPFNVVYLCSNSEIAEQNRAKLVAETDADERQYRRITELAFKSSTAPAIRLFAFTPGTSLQSSTGVAWERQLLLYLVHRVLGHEGIQFRRYFCCGVTPKKWEDDTKPAKLRERFGSLTSVAFQDTLRGEWRKAEVKWGRGAAEDDGIIRVARDLPAVVAEYDDEDDELRAKRNAVVRAMRTGLQSAALDSMEPHLVILD